MSSKASDIIRMIDETIPKVGTLSTILSEFVDSLDVNVQPMLYRYTRYLNNAVIDLYGLRTDLNEIIDGHQEGTVSEEFQSDTEEHSS